MFRLSYKLMLLFTILATLGGIITLIPGAGASYPNLIGYNSVCTFAPAATFFCFFLAGASCFIRSTFIKDQSGSPGERFRRHSPRLIALALVLAAGFFYTYRYVEIKAYYTDSTTTATLEEN
ncbi:MAG: hypothetical protein JXR86_21135 [Spirochaetales bacterium]|nr:hypothetical protein [Spirochaetales bacterium]